MRRIFITDNIHGKYWFWASGLISSAEQTPPLASVRRLALFLSALGFFFLIFSKPNPGFARSEGKHVDDGTHHVAVSERGSGEEGHGRRGGVFQQAETKQSADKQKEVQFSDNQPRVAIDTPPCTVIASLHLNLSLPLSPSPPSRRLFSPFLLALFRLSRWRRVRGGCGCSRLFSSLLRCHSNNMMKMNVAFHIFFPRFVSRQQRR